LAAKIRALVGTNSSVLARIAYCAGPRIILAILAGEARVAVTLVTRPSVLAGRIILAGIIDGTRSGIFVADLPAETGRAFAEKIRSYIPAGGLVHARIGRTRSFFAIFAFITERASTDVVRFIILTFSAILAR